MRNYVTEYAGLAVRMFIPQEPETAPPVLLVHGFASDGRADWEETGLVAALTGEGRTVIVPDLPGHGDSPAPGDPAEAGAAAIAARLAAAVGDREYDVVAYSLGSRLAWELPGQVRQAVLGGLSPFEPFASVDVEALRLAVATGADPADPLTAMIAGLVRSSGERAAGLVTCVEGLRATPFEPGAWPGERPPVFVAGRDDPMTTGVERVVALTAGAELVTVPGDHRGAVAGAEFRDTVLRALRRAGDDR